MHVERDSNTKGGFLGLANNKVKTIEQYTMDGSVHTKPNSSSTTIAQTENPKLVSKQSEVQKEQEDSSVQVLVLVLLLLCLIFPLLVGLLLVG